MNVFSSARYPRKATTFGLREYTCNLLEPCPVGCRVDNPKVTALELTYFCTQPLNMNSGWKGGIKSGFIGIILRREGEWGTGTLVDPQTGLLGKIHIGFK